MSAEIHAIADIEDQAATAFEIKRELQVLIASFPNAPGKADLSIYGVNLFDEVLAEAPSLRLLKNACRKLRRKSEFLPSIKTVLDALSDCAAAGTAIEAVSPQNLGGAGSFLLSKHGAAIYASWFAKLIIDDESGHIVTVSAPTRFQRTYVAAQYEADLLQAFQSIRSSVTGHSDRRSIGIKAVTGGVWCIGEGGSRQTICLLRIRLQSIGG